MMQVLYFDAFAGVSGDMTVAALVALGVDPHMIERSLARLPIDGYRVRFCHREVHGIRAVRFDVTVEESCAAERHAAHRRFADIRSLIAGSDLPEDVRRKALAIFLRLAEAEAQIHGVASEDVDFHEIGDVDSIVDIVATAIGLTELNVDKIFVSSLPLGSGRVETRHGWTPVPAPAVLELLKGYPVRLADGEGELVTPTGAAIVRAFAKAGEVVPPMRITGVGYGAGTRTLTDRPNLLRLVLGSAEDPCASDEMVVLEANIDDSNPELYGHVMDELFAAGARDVWLAPVQMKKNRPGTLLRVIAEPAAREMLAAVVFRETSAMGLRWFPVRRMVLQRQMVEVATEFGVVTVKIARAPDGTPNIAPEYEACRRLAAARGVALKTVYRAALQAAEKYL